MKCVQDCGSMAEAGSAPGPPADPWRFTAADHFHSSPWPQEAVPRLMPLHQKVLPRPHSKETEFCKGQPEWLLPHEVESTV